MSSVKINNEVNEVTIRRIIVWITSLSNIKTQVKHQCINSCKLWRNKNSKWVRNTHQSIFCLCTLRPWSLLFDERVPQNLPSWESTYSLPRHFWRSCSFSPAKICFRSLKCITKTSCQSPRIQSFTWLQTFSNGPDDASPGWWYWLQQVNETFLGKR